MRLFSTGHASFRKRCVVSFIQACVQICLSGNTARSCRTPLFTLAWECTSECISPSRDNVKLSANPVAALELSSPSGQSILWSDFCALSSEVVELPDTGSSDSCSFQCVGAYPYWSLDSLARYLWLAFSQMWWSPPVLEQQSQDVREEIETFSTSTVA